MLTTIGCSSESNPVKTELSLTSRDTLRLPRLGLGPGGRACFTNHVVTSRPRTEHHCMYLLTLITLLLAPFSPQEKQINIFKSELELPRCSIENFQSSWSLPQSSTNLLLLCTQEARNLPGILQFGHKGNYFRSALILLRNFVIRPIIVVTNDTIIIFIV